MVSFYGWLAGWLCLKEFSIPNVLNYRLRWRKYHDNSAHDNLSIPTLECWENNFAVPAALRDHNAASDYDAAETDRYT